ncbi:MAG: DUF1080 domain-containing protein [Phycisphaerae bacterium]
MWSVRLGACAVLLAVAWSAFAGSAAEPPKSAEDPFMGEYRGSGVMSAAGSPVQVEAKVWPVKDGYRAAILDPSGARIELEGKVEEGKLALAGAAAETQWRAIVADGKLLAESTAGAKLDLEAYERMPPTLGAKPAPGAIVLLAFEEGKPPPLEEWTNSAWQPMRDGSLQVGKGDTATRREFGDCRLHLEFMTPLMPEGVGQGRGNSGVYLQGKYEVQVLDSFGLVARKDDCGAIYGVAAPKVNACLPPLRWQTYDITFTAPQVRADGQVEQPARMTVVHNGLTIHENQAVGGTTRSGLPGKAAAVGPLMLQDHSNPVRYRNIWIVQIEGNPPE